MLKKIQINWNTIKTNAILMTIVVLVIAYFKEAILISPFIPDQFNIRYTLFSLFAIFVDNPIDFFKDLINGGHSCIFICVNLFELLAYPLYVATLYAFFLMIFYFLKIFKYKKTLILLFIITTIIGSYLFSIHSQNRCNDDKNQQYETNSPELNIDRGKLYIYDPHRIFIEKNLKRSLFYYGIKEINPEKGSIYNLTVPNGSEIKILCKTPPIFDIHLDFKIR